VKTQSSLPNEVTAMTILIGLNVSEQIRFRRSDGGKKIVGICFQEREGNKHPSQVEGQ
jgi:hypothetical protein